MVLYFILLLLSAHHFGLICSPVQVVDIMRVNVDKVLERDQKLSELDDRADALQAGASQFESCAAKLKNKYWWKNCKVRVLIRYFVHLSLWD
uniref:Vesicle associated membrane protein 1b n=1 Tax=Pygocentrus nattereri TaxID=42514 RepID=A0AAR2M3V2_PYGNA